MATSQKPPPAAIGPRTDTRLAFVVLTWNGRDDTLACLTSLAPQVDDADRVYVVDNGSTDGTEAAVRSAFPGVSFLQNRTNLGFAGGNNPALERALEEGADWVLLLNNDTEISAGSIASLRAHAAAASPKAGALQPVLVRASDLSKIDSAGHGIGLLPGVRDLASGREVGSLPAEPLPIFGACGAAALLRREALHDAGLLDSALFVLFEDVDLMFRIRAAGFDVALLPDVIIRHQRGVSNDSRPTDPVARARRRFWAQRNIVALALRWWPTPTLLAAIPLLLLRAVIAATLTRRHGFGGCISLWRSSWRQRRANRAAMREHGVDRWFGRDPLP